MQLLTSCSDGVGERNLLEHHQKELLLWEFLYNSEMLLTEQKDYWRFLRNNMGLLHGVTPVWKLCSSSSAV